MPPSIPPEAKHVGDAPENQALSIRRSYLQTGQALQGNSSLLL